MATIITTTSAEAWAPDLNVFAPAEALPDALVLNHAAVVGTIEGDEPVARVAFVRDDEAQFVREGATIPEAAPELSEVAVSTGKLSMLVRISREQYKQQATAGTLADSVRRALTRGADKAFLSQTPPVAPELWPPAGISHDPNLVAGDPISSNLDPLVDLLAQLEANGSSPSAIITDPLAWAALSKIKTATGAATPLLGAGTAATERMLLGVPVVVNNALAANTGLVIDSTAVVAAVGPVEIGASEHAYFDSDSVAVRGTWRMGARLMHPDRCGVFSITTAP